MVRPNSRLKYTSWIFATTFTLSFASSLPQETSVRREINSHNCSDKVYPSVTTTSDLNATELKITKLMMAHNSTVILTCYEFYPVEWVFQERPSEDVVASLRERREWIMSENGELLQRFLIDVTLNCTSNVQNITCRAATEGEVCRQTTVKFFMTDNNGINSAVAAVYKGLPRGNLLQQYYIASGGNNINCSLQIIYNHAYRRFECYGLNEDHAVSMNLSDEIRADLCYDPFSCGLLYETKVTHSCRNKFPRGTNYLRATLKHSLYNSDVHTGIATCHFSVASEKNRLSFEDWEKIFASSHFFEAKIMYCEGSTETLRKRRFHTDVDPLSLSDEQHSDFIKLCGLENGHIIIGHTLNVTCHTSVYLFAEGVRMKITMHNGSESNVTDISMLYLDNPLKIKKEGYYIYSVNITVNSVDIREISCLAPLRKSTRWAVKATPVQVEYQEPLQFYGNTSESVLVTPGSDVTLDCYAYGNPIPDYEWKDSVTGLPLPNDWIGLSRTGGRVITIPSRNISMLVGDLVCVARNTHEHIVKTFSFSFERSKIKLADTSDYIEENWFSIGGIVAVILLIFVGGTFTFLVRKIVHQRRNLRLLNQVELEEFINGNPEVLFNSRSNSEYDINTYSAFLPYNRNFEVLNEQIELDVSTVLGSGAYGIVLKGYLTIGDTEKVQVAIKTSKPMDDISYLKALMSELKIMGFIGKHENIVNLLGANTENLRNNEIFIAIEYCENGCLLNYLRYHRESFVERLQIGELPSNVGSLPNVFTSTTLLKWCMQISNGMHFLCQKKVIHGDLAARNVLLTSNLTAKIGDFGLSRQLFEYANYIKKQQSPLPWKWLAIECLQDMKFSPQSDVWAYGITLWEIFTLGHSPFPGCLYDENFIDSLVGGKRPVQPQYAQVEWYNLMRRCWVMNPLERPSFADISLYFDNTIRSITHEEYMNIDSTSSFYSTLPVNGAQMTDVNI